MRLTLVALIALGTTAAIAATESCRSWLHNPSPANYVLQDAHGRW